ncbi:hypothetical protein TWF281_004430 [Arthrobotrys megalospora]
MGSLYTSASILALLKFDQPLSASILLGLDYLEHHQSHSSKIDVLNHKLIFPAYLYTKPDYIARELYPSWGPKKYMPKIDHLTWNDADITASGIPEIYEGELGITTDLTSTYPTLTICVAPESSGGNRTIDTPVPLLGLLAISMYLMDLLMM